MTWGIVPVDNTDWNTGVSAGFWRGKGAYYGDDHYGAGWVGVKSDGQQKAFVHNVVGLRITISGGVAPLPSPPLARKRPAACRSCRGRHSDVDRGPLETALLLLLKASRHETSAPL